MKNKKIINGALGVIYKETGHGPKFLIVKNKFSGNYSPPGGATEEGETNYEALKRELKEEINYVFDDKQAKETGIINKFIFNHKKSSRDGCSGRYELFIIKEKEWNININPEDVTDYFWMFFEELYPLLPYKSLKDAYKKAVEKI